MAKAPVEFIITDGPELGADKRTRFLIRQRAAILAATSRPHKTSKKVARRKAVLPGTSRFPLTTDKEEEATSDTVKCLSRHERASSERRLPVDLVLLSSTPFNTKYESARSRFGVDLIELSVLVNGSVCGLSTDNIGNASTWLSTILDKSQWSYLQFIPSRYGHTHCLTKATDSLMLRMFNTLIAEPTHQQLQQELKAHTSALRALQTAIQNPALSKSADVLCASQLLSLYELLDSAANQTWSHHVRGCAELIQHREPERIESDFDIALFLANIEPSIFNASQANQHLYLEKPEWIELHQSLAQEGDGLTYRRPIVIRIRVLLIKVLGLWVNFNDVVFSPEFLNEDTRSDLLQAATVLHAEVNDSLYEYDDYCQKTALVDVTAREMAIRKEVLGFMLTTAIVIKRLVVTVCDEGDRLALEDELYRLAETLMCHQEHSAYAGLFNNHEVTFARSILETRLDEPRDESHLSMLDCMLSRRAKYLWWAQIAWSYLSKLAG